MKKMKKSWKVGGNRKGGGGENKKEMLPLLFQVSDIRNKGNQLRNDIQVQRHSKNFCNANLVQDETKEKQK